MHDPVDPWPEYCRRINKHYLRGNLRILVGAGLSVDSGLPSWDDLNRKLLRRYIEKELDASSKPKRWKKGSLDKLVGNLYETLGRDAAADFIWDARGQESFFEHFCSVLYGERSMSDLQPTQTHQQLVAMKQVALFTMNFDPLLELARYQFEGGELSDPDLSPYRSAHPPQPNVLLDPAKVYHIHGWIDPDGLYGGSFVLTESQYFELSSRQEQRANQMLDYALTSGGAALILGMSLSDRNLRRQLYLRSRNQVSDLTEIYAVLRSHRNDLDRYESLHWARRGVRIVYVGEYGDITTLLREVQFGLPANPSDPFPWIQSSLGWLSKCLPEELLFSDQWQATAHTVLQQIVEVLRESHNISSQEKISVILMGPVTQQQITVLADSLKRRTGEEARAYTAEFHLKVERIKPQGVAGVAFSQGRTFEMIDNLDESEAKFLGSVGEAYAGQGLRSWKSLLAVPVFETSDYLPVAVVTVASNQAKPFWTQTQTSGQLRQELESELSRAILALLNPSNASSA